ncbi:hypothetical protein HY546_03285 [archaeon]|nr:hypothetical protein [archaeon]
MVKFGIVEFGAKLAQFVEEEISEEVANSSFIIKRVADLFDLLAYARKLSQEVDHLILFAELDEEQKTQNDAFYNGLAVLSADTGKPIFKLIYNAGEAGEREARELAAEILEKLYGKKREKEEPDEEGGEEFSLPEMAEPEEPFELEDSEE